MKLSSADSPLFQAASAAFGVSSGKAAATGVGKTVAAAADFEALMIGELLRAAREGNSVMSGENGEDDSIADTAMSIGEQGLAKVLASHGGIGLAKMAEKSLAASASQDAANTGDSSQRIAALATGSAVPTAAGLQTAAEPF